MNTGEARDVMCKVALDAWIAEGYLADNVRWDDRAGSVPSENVTWARVTIRHNEAPQRSISEQPLYEPSGTLYVQIFTPVGDGMTDDYKAADAVVSAYRRARNLGVYFRNARIKEVGVSGAFQQTNVLVDFSYDQR